MNEKRVLDMADDLDIVATNASILAFAAAIEAALLEGKCLVPVEPTEKLLASMAMRWDHSFGIMAEPAQQMLMRKMKQVHEEVVGDGFYQAAPKGGE